MLMAPVWAQAQTLGERIKENTKKQVENRLEQRSGESVEKGMDKVEEKAKGKKNKKNKGESNSDIKSSRQENNPPGSDNSNTTNTGSESGTGQSQNTTTETSKDNSLKAYSKFDFIPGEKILYYDDFSTDAVGDFPLNWNTNSSGEVMTMNNTAGKWFSMTKNGVFIPESIKELPDNFTLEFDIAIVGDPSNNYSGFGLNFSTTDDNLFKDVLFSEGSSILYLHPGADLASVSILPSNGGTEIANDIPMPQWSVNDKRVVKFSVWRQKGRLRVYANESKLVDMPRFFAETSAYKFGFFRRFFYDCEILMTNIRYAAGNPDTRSKLITEGRLSTTGILFDVNADRIKSESYGTLKEIAQALKDNPSVNIKIIGHTDSDGDEAANLHLSEQRAEAVKNALVKEFSIEASRMVTEGKGEKEPISPNNTATGKAANRRVEFIKQSK